MVIVPVNFRFVEKEIEHIVNNSDSKAIIFAKEFWPKIKQIRQSFKNIKPGCHICVGEKETYCCEILPCIDYEFFLSQASEEKPKISVRKDDVYFLGYTSGTTGFPKGAVRNHGADAVAIWEQAFELNFVRDTVSLMVMPLFHCNSVWFSLTTLICGGTVCIYPEPSFNPQKILEIIEKERITFISMVPTMYAMILSLSDEVKDGCNTSSLRNLLCSSAPLMTKTKEEILAFFKQARLYEGYGATELGLVTLLQPEDQLRKKRCIGKPISGVKVEMREGEIFVKTQARFMEYYKNTEATKSAFSRDWVTVGDMGKIDDEGYFYLTDRKNDVINSGGEKVFPTEVEEVISRCPGVKEVAVVGAPDEKWGEKVVAVIVSNAKPEEIINFCKDKLAGYKKPKLVEIVSELPKSLTGKILRRLVREKYWKDREIKI